MQGKIVADNTEIEKMEDIQFKTGYYYYYEGITPPVG